MRKILLPLILILGVILLRGVTLELTDLVDPTESRYAIIAQEMYQSGDWVTPRLPLHGGEWVPYLGKPPLHFWLTALSYHAFGVEEWTSRLPSFLAMLGVAACVFYLGMLSFGVEIALTSVLIVLTSGLHFFFAGASVVDLTLSFWITLALTAAFIINRTASPSRSWGLIFFAAVACGFMTKGPVAIILTGFPLLIWSIIQRDFSFARKLPWISGTLLALLITVPWFVLAQRANPDFLHYFFVVENFGRYLQRDYGDLYGSGHVYPYGSAWWMLAVGFLPWTVVILWKWRAIGTLFRKATTPEGRDLAFFMCWGLAPTLFFTLARQLLPSYLLPGFGGVTLLVGWLIHRSMADVSKRFATFVVSALLLFAVVIFVGELWYQTSPTQLLIVAGISALTLFFAHKVYLAQQAPQFVRLFSFVLALLFANFLYMASPEVSRQRSSERVIEYALSRIPGKSNRLGLVNRGPYSSYWSARNWKIELSEPVEFEIIPQADLLASTIRNVLIDRKTFKSLPETVLANFKVMNNQGKWIWIRRLRSPKRDILATTTLNSLA